MYIISLFIVALASYALGKILARFFFGFVFDLIAERNIHLAMLYLVCLLALMIVTLIYMAIRIF